MTQPTEPLPPHLAEPSRIGPEISVTGKWIPKKQGGRFRKFAEWAYRTWALSVLGNSHVVPLGTWGSPSRFERAAVLLGRLSSNRCGLAMHSGPSASG